MQTSLKLYLGLRFKASCTAFFTAFARRQLLQLETLFLPPLFKKYAKCLPVLLYGTEASYISVRDKRSLEFTVSRTSSANIAEAVIIFFISYQLAI